MRIPFEVREVTVRTQGRLPVREVEVRWEDRPGEIAAADADIGENSPGLLPIATMVDKGGIHSYLLHV
jgi:hypothetical protein